MHYNIKMHWVICIVSFLFFAHTNTFIPKESEGSNPERTKNLSLESITCFLSQGLVILELIEKMDEEIQKNLGVLCGGCQKKILSPAELAGCLCGAGDLSNVEKLKVSLANKNPQDINNFILSVAEEEKIACAFCEKYYGWLVRDLSISL